MSTALAKSGQTAKDILSPKSNSHSQLSGAQRALLFLVSIDESIATRVLGKMSESEVIQLRQASSSFDEVDAVAIVDIYREFIRYIREGVPTSLKGSSAYLRRLAGKALGEGRIADVWEQEELKNGPVAQLAKLDEATVLPILEKEHPQTLAVIFSLMEPARAGELLKHFQADQQSEILRRLAILKTVPDTVVHQIEEQFAQELSMLGEIKQRNLDGIEAAASVLKRLDSDAADELIDELGMIDVEAAERVRKAMFTFENLIRVDGRGMQTLLKEVTTDQLVLAMKTASDDLKEKIFASVSSRAATTLRDELELLGPVRLAEVEGAQQEIIQAAMRLEKDGQIVIAREGGGDYV